MAIETLHFLEKNGYFSKNIPQRRGGKERDMNKLLGVDH